jgi:RNA recognition motif-containing protein
MQLSKILSGVLVLLLAPLAMAVPLDSEANIVPRSNNRIFVGGLPISTSNETLESMLAQSGHVVDVHIFSDTKWNNHKPKYMGNY